jgi:PAS domain S-box-containing protein
MTVEAALTASTSPGDQRAGEGICRSGRLRADALWAGFWLGLAVALFLLSRENFLLFHSLVELFTVAVAIAIFTLAWNTRHLVENSGLLSIGFAYLAIALITVLHTLAYKGMGIFAAEWGANLPTQLWVAARFIEALAWLSLPFLLRRNAKAGQLALFWGGLCLLMLLLIFFWRIFPDCYLEGSGLTPFKRVSEYLVCLVLLIALLLLFRQRHAFHGQVFRLISLALLAAIGGGLFFAVYLDIYGLTNVLGHYLHGLSFLLLYLALVAAQLKRPLDTLFRELDQERQRYATILHTALDGFLVADDQGRILTVNQAYCRMGGYAEEDLLGRNLAEFKVLEGPTAAGTSWENLKEQGEGRFEARHRRKDGRSCDVEVSFQYQPSEDGRLIAFLRDITQQRQVEKLLHARLRLSQAATDLSLVDLLARVMDEAEVLTDSSIGFFHFLEKDQQTLYLQAWSRSTTAHFCRAEGQGQHYPVDQAGVWVDCVRERRAVIHNDYKNLPHRRGLPPGHAEVHREMVVPIFRDGLIVAIFGVGNKREAYTDEDVELVTSLGEMAWDIVLRQRAEEELRRSEEWSRMQIELALDGILVGSPEGVITRANRSICSMLGLSEAELVGRHISQLPFTQQSLAEQPFRFDLLTQGEIVTRDRILVHADGTLVAVEMRSGVLPDGTYQSILRDVTERRRARKLLEEQADFTRRVLDSTDAHIAILNQEGKIIGVNSAWSRFARENHGDNPEKLGVGASYFCPWSLADGDTTAAAEAFAGVRRAQRGEVDSFELVYPCHSPSAKRWFTMRVLPLTGDPGSVLVSHTDITALKETEESLSATLAEREVLIREVHHRVKNNLAAIVGLLEMQRRVLVDPLSREILTELGGRIRSMSLIHEKLYRSENLARIDFQHYLTALTSHLCTSYGSAQILCRSEAVGVEMPLDLAVPCGMIVNELVTNALKYAFPPEWTAAGGNDAGRIGVAISQEKGFYTLSVSDNGIGLPFGFDWTTANSMGMVLIRMLGAHQLGGTFSLEQNGGLSVTLRFPIKRGRK